MNNNDDSTRVDGQLPPQPGVFKGSAHATPMDMVTNPAPVSPASAPQVVQEQVAYPVNVDMSQANPAAPSPAPEPPQENS